MFYGHGVKKVNSGLISGGIVGVSLKRESGSGSMTVFSLCSTVLMCNKVLLMRVKNGYS